MCTTFSFRRGSKLETAFVLLSKFRFRPRPSIVATMTPFPHLRSVRRPWFRLAVAAVVCGAFASPGTSRAQSAFVAPTPPPVVQSSGPTTAADAARLLTQATFGPTDSLIAQVQASGVKGFLDQQFKIPPTSFVAYLQQSGVAADERSSYYLESPWWQNALYAPDQLRQRVAFALSEIMVVSAVGPSEHPYGLAGYMDVLCQDCFGTFRQLLQDVTLSPEMGTYLNMAGNAVGNPAENTHPNENYAREVMQLFTLGLNQLNPDGTPQLDASGQPIPTYTQDTVTNFARVFTGWTYAPVTGQAPTWKDRYNPLPPMVAVVGYHDTAAKTLLDGTTIRAGGTAQSDLKTALDDLANHPNVGPFFCQRLIQRLVTSNPSPGYVDRVASVFNNDGAGVRGDLKAVITAILTDYEARSADWAAGPNFGKQREPLVRLTNVLRAFHAVPTSAVMPLLATNDALAQAPLRAPSVFNFFSPTYTVGLLAARGLAAPEFQITTESTTVSSANLMHELIYTGFVGQGGTLDLDLSALAALNNSPASMTAYLNNLLLAGQMSPAMQNIVTTAIAAVPVSRQSERARTALEIVATSPEFVIQK